MRRRNNSPVFITNPYNLLGMQLELGPCQKYDPCLPHGDMGSTEKHAGLHYCRSSINHHLQPFSLSNARSTSRYPLEGTGGLRHERRPRNNSTLQEATFSMDP